MSNYDEHRTDVEPDEAADARDYEVPNLTILGAVTKLTESIQVSSPRLVG